MNMYLVVILLAFGLTSCTVKDEQYYLNNPKELQHALKSCPNQQPQGLSCEKMQQIGDRLNSLGYQLQRNPPGFGNTILALQQTIAKKQLELKTNPANQELQSSLDKDNHELAELLAVVRWLESPES